MDFVKKSCRNRSLSDGFCLDPRCHFNDTSTIYQRYFDDISTIIIEEISKKYRRRIEEMADRVPDGSVAWRW